ncbi:MAG: outer membrane beta-barrel protein [Bacteroidales bacterium]|nr:outer membrane beta-barrel protein [Bacteroidales bacterium]
MGKQKINLEQLYQERFQSFEMKQSTDINLKMKNKIRYSKNQILYKWIAIAAVITATAIAISLFNMNTAKPETNLTSPVNKQITETNKQNLINNNTPNSNNHEADNTQDLNNQADERFSLQEPPQTKNNSPNNALAEPVEKDEIKVFSESVIETSEQNLIINNLPNTYNNELAEQIEKDELKVFDESIMLIKKESPKQHVPNRISSAVINEKSFRETKNLPSLNSNHQLLNDETSEFSIKKENLKLIPEIQFIRTAEKSKSKKKYKTKTPKLNETSSLLSGYIDLHFSPLLWQNNANIMEPELDTNWKHNLKSQAQLSYEIGFAFQLHHKNIPLFLQMGLDYQILKEKVDFQLNHTFEDPDLSYWHYDSIFDIHDILDTFYIIIDSNQFVIDSIFIQDTVLSDIDSVYNPVMSSEEKKKKHLNTYSYITIPLLLGYEFNTPNEKWSIQILAGAAVSINLQNEGYYYTTYGEIESYSGKVTPSLIWNLQAAANLNYRWKKWQFFLQPEFQYQLKENQIQNNIPGRKYQFYKLKFGIRWNVF